MRGNQGEFEDPQMPKYIDRMPIQYPNQNQMNQPSGISQPSTHGPQGQNKLFPQDNESNNILFISDLPRDIEHDQLLKIFSNYPGFREIRQAKHSGVAFIEYSTIEQAKAVKNEIKRDYILSE